MIRRYQKGSIRKKSGNLELSQGDTGLRSGSALVDLLHDLVGCVAGVLLAPKGGDRSKNGAALLPPIRPIGFDRVFPVTQNIGTNISNPTSSKR